MGCKVKLISQINLKMVFVDVKTEKICNEAAEG